MWQVKTFKTKDQMQQFINTHRIAYSQIYIENTPYAIEYKRLTETYKENKKY